MQILNRVRGQKVLSTALAGLVMVTATLLAADDALAAATQISTQKPGLSEYILEIPVGAVVQVQLKSKQKLRGQLVSTTADGFIVKIAKGNATEDTKVSFGEVKSVKWVSKGHSNGWHVLVALGVLAGICVGIALIVVASGHGGS